MLTSQNTHDETPSGIFATSLLRDHVEKRRIRILIADDHVVVRSGLRALLGAAADLEVVGEAVDGDEALRLAGLLKPDLILLDITMPPRSGILTAQMLKEMYPEILVLFLTMHEDESLLHEALRSAPPAT